MLTQAVRAIEIDDMMAEIVESVAATAEVMARNLPILREALTEDNINSAMLIDYDIPAVAPQFDPNSGEQTHKGNPGRLNPPMTLETLARYTASLTDLEAIEEVLTKTEGGGKNEKSRLDKVRILGRRRRNGIR